MKCLLLSCLILGVLAEPPRFRPARYQFQRQILAPTTTDLPTEGTTETLGPYLPSGWRPAGEPFTLPNENQQPADQYGAPDGPYAPSGWRPKGQAFQLPKEVIDNRFDVPDNTYGAPANTYGAPDSTEASTTDNPQAEELAGPVEVQKSIGTYYVILSNGELQKVEYDAGNDVQNVKYTGRLPLQNPTPLLVFRL